MLFGNIKNFFQLSKLSLFWMRESKSLPRARATLRWATRGIDLMVITDLFEISSIDGSKVGISAVGVEGVDSVIESVAAIGDSDRAGLFL